MRYRKLAALLTGALALGALTAPGLASPAHAAPIVTSTTSDLVCTYSAFVMADTVEMEASYDGNGVTATLSDITFAVMPSNFLVHSMSATLTGKADTTPISLTGSASYGTPLAGNAALPFPELAGSLASPVSPAGTTIEKLDLLLSIKTPYAPVPSNATITCVPAIATTTTLAATSTGPNSVNLVATVAPATAGAIEFFEGAASLGSVDVTEGAASKGLTGVTAGSHSYSAVFTPSAMTHSASTAGPVSVTVSNPPVVTPPKPPAVSAACTAAKASAAALAVKATKAKKKFKKAKGAKKAKLKKKYKAAKKKATAAKKKVGAAC